MPERLTHIPDGDWDALNRQRVDIQKELDFVPNPIYVGVTSGAPGFTNSWVNFDGNNPPTDRSAFFYKDRGRTFLGGVIKTGTSNTSAWTLPTGFRPIFQCSLPVFASGGVARVDVATDGTVTPINIGATAVTSFVFLEINFVTHR